MGSPLAYIGATDCIVLPSYREGTPRTLLEAADLAAKMEQLLSLTQEQRSAMGLRGRAKMEAEFVEQIVIQKYLSVLNALSQK